MSTNALLKLCVPPEQIGALPKQFGGCAAAMHLLRDGRDLFSQIRVRKARGRLCPTKHNPTDNIMPTPRHRFQIAKPRGSTSLAGVQHLSCSRLSSFQS